MSKDLKLSYKGQLKEQIRLACIRENGTLTKLESVKYKEIQFGLVYLQTF